jgi:hypothetical protein
VEAQRRHGVFAAGLVGTMNLLRARVREHRMAVD